PGDQLEEGREQLSQEHVERVGGQEEPPQDSSPAASGALIHGRRAQDPATGFNDRGSRPLLSMRSCQSGGGAAPASARGITVPRGDIVSESSMNAARLDRAFFARPTLQVARELIGKLLVRVRDGQRLSGTIVETE